MLRLSLPVDGRVGDHRHLFLEKVGQVLAANGDGGQRTVVAEGGDGFLALFGYGSQITQITVFPGQGRQQIIPQQPLAATEGGGCWSLARSQLQGMGQLAAVAGQGSTAAKALVSRLAKFFVAQHSYRLFACSQQTDLFPRCQGFGVGNDLFLGDDADLRGDEIFPFCFAKPEGPQAHSVDAEHAVAAMAGDDGRRTLGAGLKQAAEKGVHGKQLFRQLFVSIEDGGEDQFHGFEEGQVEAADQSFENSVEVLRIAAAGWQFHA